MPWAVDAGICSQESPSQPWGEDTLHSPTTCQSNAVLQNKNCLCQSVKQHGDSPLVPIHRSRHRQQRLISCLPANAVLLVTDNANWL